MNATSADTGGDTFTLAVLQHAPTPLDIEGSLRRLGDAMISAADHGADLLLVPECSLTGYNLRLDDARAIAVAHDGDVMAQLASRCRTHDVALAFGYIEREGDALFNTAMVIDQQGVTQARYRKTHLWGTLDRSLFQAGNQFAAVVQIAGWQIGLLICYDIEFPESVRSLALAGAELVLTPTALMSPWDFVARQLVPARAAESQVFVGYANYCGAEDDIDYVGQSCIVDPTGMDMARAGATPELLLARLSRDTLTTIRRDLPYLTNRRPELYGALT